MDLYYINYHSNTDSQFKDWVNANLNVIDLKETSQDYFQVNESKYIKIIDTVKINTFINNSFINGFYESDSLGNRYNTNSKFPLDEYLKFKANGKYNFYIVGQINVHKNIKSILLLAKYDQHFIKNNETKLYVFNINSAGLLKSIILIGSKEYHSDGLSDGSIEISSKISNDLLIIKYKLTGGALDIQSIFPSTNTRRFKIELMINHWGFVEMK